MCHRTIPLAFAFVICLLCHLTPHASAQDVDALELLGETSTSGGLVVHVNCGDGQLMTAVAGARPSLVVHGLSVDPQHVAQARQRFAASSNADRLSAELWDRKSLPYAENLVNLLIAEDADWLTTEDAMRLLVPGGALIRLGDDGDWTVEGKPAASAAGEWTHYQYDAAGNPVAPDSGVGLPRRFQWSGKPLWSAAHESMASVNAMVSANGRVFYIIDEGPRASIQLPEDWQLVARDAYNGTVLWKKPLTKWLTRFWPWKSGPAQMPRKLVAVGDRVYSPLDVNGPLMQFDAATGEELQTYEGTGAAEEVIHTDGILLVQVNPDPRNMAEVEAERQKRRNFNYDSRNRAIIDHDTAKRIVALDAEGGEELWSRVGPRVLPLTLASQGGNVVYHNGERVICLDLKTGEEKWASEPIQEKLKTYSEDAPTLALHEDAVLFAWNRKMRALSMEDGTTLWTSNWTSGDYRSPVTVMLMNDLLWSMDITSARANGTFTGRDVLTGEVKKTFDLPPFKGIGHHRCYKAKAAGDYVLLSRSGVEYVNPAAESYDEHHWIRGACLYGIMPANGMLYSTPHACACYIKGKVNGFIAMAPGPTEPAPPSDGATDRTEQGPAFGDSAEDLSHDDDWPTYRHDVRRTGRTMASVTSELRETWAADVGGELSSVTIGHGLVLVAQRDRNTVQALRSEDGAKAWQFTAGGTIDSPPTIDGGQVYFGSADGSIYCLRASDGVLAWWTRIAPAERRVMSFGRVESAWPVHGSVLVQNGFVYGAAGRSSFLDGGINIVKLNAKTGRILTSFNVYDLDENGKQPEITKSFEMDGALPDILSGDDERVFMRHHGFDQETLSPREPAAHLYSPTGYLDDNWWHRTYWVYGEDTTSGYGGWWQSGNKLPAGRLMVYDDERVYAFGRTFYAGMNTPQFTRPGEKYVLYAAEKRSGEEPDYAEVQQARRRGEDLGIDWTKYRTTPITWSEQLPFHVRAMVQAGRTLFVCGPYGDALRSMDSFEGKRGVRLAAVNADDGTLTSSYAIEVMPVFDGLAAANGRLFISMQDGTVRCFGSEGRELPSAMDDEIEELPEELLASDEEYRKLVGELVGLPGQNQRRRPVNGKSLAGEFTKVNDGKVVRSPLGYRLGAANGKVAVALHQLDEPITTQARWKLQMQAAKGFPNPPYYQNGFFVFGNGDSDEQLVKCGLQFVRGIARIITEGPTTGNEGASTKLDGKVDGVFELEVAVDLESQEVTLTANGQTLKAPLKQPLQSISHIGYLSWDAVTDFSEVEAVNQATH